MSIELENINDSSGNGNKGNSSFPTTVTSSGSSLPSASGYQLNDTFLNTSDKKIYKTEVGGYQFNSDVTNSNATFVATSGVAQFPATYSYITRKAIIEQWKGSGVTIRVHFKLNNTPATNQDYLLFKQHISTYGSPGTYYYTSFYIHLGKITLYQNTHSYGTTVVQDHTTLCNTELETGKEYYLEVVKNGDTVNVTLSLEGYGINPIETNTAQTVDNYPTGGPINWSETGYQYGSNFIVGEIYLVDSTGEFVIPDTTSLFWDSGVSLTDKTEYADKTNGILYLYENDELVKIGGSLTKKVYTISADNTSTLNVSSDFTKVVDVLKNGVELALTDDYTISSGVITFVTALSTTDKITVKGE